MTVLARVFAAIDQINSEDPTLHLGEPLALKQGILATKWLEKLAVESDSDASSLVLQSVVRGHHIGRWQVKREDFPEGKAGYLRWRQKNKKHQADLLAKILQAENFSDDEIAWSRVLLLRSRLGKDPETQLLEDAACLVFLEIQMDEMVSRLGHEHMVRVVIKTLKKMSPEAINLSAGIVLSSESQQVIAEAAAA